MLGKKDDFLGTFFDRLARRLGQEMLRERQNLDGVYYTTKARNIGHKKRIRPARLNVIIEHENKLTTLFDMRHEVDTLWPEAAKTTYLFFVGQLPQRGTLPVWLYCDSSNRKLRQVIP